MSRPTLNDLLQEKSANDALTKENNSLKNLLHETEERLSVLAATCDTFKKLLKASDEKILLLNKIISLLEKQQVWEQQTCVPKHEDNTAKVTHATIEVNGKFVPVDLDKVEHLAQTFTLCGSKLIQRIKAVRELTGAGLRDAKFFVESHFNAYCIGLLMACHVWVETPRSPFAVLAKRKTETPVSRPWDNCILCRLVSHLIALPLQTSSMVQLHQEQRAARSVRPV